MGHRATNGAPPWAITTWVDDNYVYTQIPSTNGGPPLIQTYTLTDGGLGKALSTLRDIHRKHNPPGLGYHFLPIGRKPVVHAASHKKIKLPSGTPEQRETARQILKRLKIL